MLTICNHESTTEELLDFLTRQSIATKDAHYLGLMSDDQFSNALHNLINSKDHAEILAAANALKVEAYDAIKAIHEEELDA